MKTSLSKQSQVIPQLPKLTNQIQQAPFGCTNQPLVMMSELEETALAISSMMPTATECQFECRLTCKSPEDLHFSSSLLSLLL